MKQFGWIVFLVIGALILLFAAYNAFYIPALDPADPDEGWEWLTTDPEIIEYIKFNFRVQGMWQFGYGLLVMAAFVLRRGSRWAWLGLWSVPLVLVFMFFMMPWTLPFIMLPMAAGIGALILSRPRHTIRNAGLGCI